jgi:hypothetical protein
VGAKNAFGGSRTPVDLFACVGGSLTLSGSGVTGPNPWKWKNLRGAELAVWNHCTGSDWDESRDATKCSVKSQRI